MRNKKKLFLSIFIAVITMFVYAAFVNVCISSLIKNKSIFLAEGIIQAATRLVLSIILWISIYKLFNIKIKIKKVKFIKGFLWYGLICRYLNWKWCFVDSIVINFCYIGNISIKKRI